MLLYVCTGCMSDRARVRFGADVVLYTNTHGSLLYMYMYVHCIHVRFDVAMWKVQMYRDLLSHENNKTQAL